VRARCPFTRALLRSIRACGGCFGQRNSAANSPTQYDWKRLKSRRASQPVVALAGLPLVTSVQARSPSASNA
jgi:hypothetical protein